MGKIIDADVTPIEEISEKQEPKTWKEKMQAGFDFVVEKTSPTVHKIADNIGWVVPAIGLTVSFISIIGSALSGDKKREACLVEDDFTGEDLMVKHPLTNSDILEMSDRMKTDGVTKAEALDDMGLLKNERRRKI